MRKIVLLLMGSVCLFFSSCKKQKTVDDLASIKVDIGENEFGYTSTNPIMIGGAKDSIGPESERIYLKELVDLDGNPIVYNRVGSCCPFATENGRYGRGLLDVYKVYVEGKKDTIELYMNMYERDTIKAPKGFKFKYEMDF
ncbi:hypothetical protein [Myroides sp. LoEW2-1]|uniref:hypothetical protein n=1 Tax=Myroides sp. LoEW2-1 TaxID=2683192 RepID=UPI0013296391|nr:hypothetical protein [Myroides sp. LoEW2-1]MVX34898.1 hypothetical protein [Myroides sp. LoEW2-1]